MKLTLRYSLITFNDYGPDIKKNVEVVIDTSDIKVIGSLMKGVGLNVLVSGVWASNSKLEV